MKISSEARRAGAHRKLDNSAKRRVAFVAVAAGAVTSAGAAGATAGAAQAEDGNAGHAPATAILAQGQGTAPAAAPEAPQTPQILEVPQAKPVSDLTGQLDSALRFAQERIAADLAARAPLAVKPADGAFTSPFGMRWGTMHKGIDIANVIGTPILSVEDGTVIDAGPASGFGQWVRVKHDDGTITVYGHVATIDVTVGQHVTAGQKIAGMGNEGFSTGTHLHFEVHPSGGEAIDPVPWLAARNIFV